ncbi:uridine kinase [Asanoa hainanensis]|uniref:Uridine kinase n=1 Tax=Asanoa hainanensis TaxID=560556 RepID=A0A239NCG4_9ACTN|nr:hypothetical protein [Asanoa hainanensis]SNT51938.1 uridine kinase [Asanoa hainanensis]
MKLVTLTGGAGAGKTTLAAAIGAGVVVHQDDYYHFADPGRGVWMPDENGVPRLDVGDPRSVDFTRLDHDVSDALETSALVIVEGMFAIDVRPTRPCVRLDVFVDLPADLRLARKIYRQCVEGDMPLHILLTNYLNHRRAAYERHVEPSRDRCDLVVDAQLPTEHLAATVRGLLRAVPTAP